MKAEQETFTLKCESMGQHDATLGYYGPISKEGALALTRKLEHLFGYYQYNKVILGIESPGGEVDGLDYLLRVLSQHAKQGKWVETRTTFKCASAAAVLLAAGRFGSRRVGVQTQLLFHSSRMQGADIEWTAKSSTMLTKALLSIDRKVIDTLLERLICACDGGDGFVAVVSARLDYVSIHWGALAPQLTTLTSPDTDVAVPQWLKALNRIVKPQGNPEMVIASFKRYLTERFQTDKPMAALEAFVLCLIDEVQGVIQGDQVPMKPTHHREGVGEYEASRDDDIAAMTRRLVVSMV